MPRIVTVVVEGREYRVEVGSLRERPVKATVNGRTYAVDVPGADRDRAEATEAPPAAQPAPSPSGSREIAAPMPGDITEIRVRPGDSVRAGDVVCVLDAMKMKNMIHASQDGVVATVEVVPGQAVDYGTVLLTLA